MELVLVGLIGLIVIVTLLASRLNDNSFPFLLTVNQRYSLQQRRISKI